MKKMFLLLMVGLAGVFAASAQKTELTVGYGGYTQMDATNMHDHWGNVDTAWGAVTAGVNFKVAPNIWVGPSYTFSSTTAGHGSHHSNIYYHVVMLNGRYQYYRNGDFKMYAKAGLGVDISHMSPRNGDSYNKGYFAFQAVPVGAEYYLGSGVSLYGEAGFGAQGLIQVGAKFNLK